MSFDLSPLTGSQCRITKPVEGTTIKCGPRVRPEEAEALKLAHSLDLPVPRVHGVTTESTGHTAIKMDFIQGQTLEDVWSDASPDQKKEYAKQLGKILGTMRSLVPDQQVIRACGDGGGPVVDRRGISRRTGGPFDYEGDFNTFILDLFRATPTPLRNALGGALRTDHRIMFTHADLSPRNLIVVDGQIKALLDWEHSGWYPEHWEYVKFFDCVTACKDWKDYAEIIFHDAYPSELVVHQAIIRWQKA